MHADPQSLMPAADPALAGRHDLYGPVHKGLRRAAGQRLAALGSADFRVAQPALLAELRELLSLGAKHIEHERVHVHGALEARRPGAAVAADGDHATHAARFEELEALVAAVERADDASRPGGARRLYLAYAAFVAEDLEHMHAEETVLWPALCEAFDDDELRAIEGGIVGSMAPETMMAFMRLMLPAMTPAERAALMAGMQAAAPPEAVAAVLEHAARPTLAPTDYRTLETGLRLAA